MALALFSAACGKGSVEPRSYTESRLSPAAPDGVRWTTPNAWTEEPGDGMRLATFRIHGRDSLDGSLVVLPGNAGGLEANVLRWASQSGVTLEPGQAQALLAGENRERTASGLPFTVVDLRPFLPADARDSDAILAAMIPRGDQTVFLKLTGDLATLTEQRTNFLSLCRSVR